MVVGQLLRYPCPPRHLDQAHGTPGENMEDPAGRRTQAPEALRQGVCDAPARPRIGIKPHVPTLPLPANDSIINEDLHVVDDGADTLFKGSLGHPQVNARHRVD